jgi:hypothetical protein
MKKVLAIKTPVGGIVQIIPREDSDTAVGLSWRELALSDAEKEASRLYLFDEGFIEHAVGSLEPDIEIQRFLRDIIDINRRCSFSAFWRTRGGLPSFRQISWAILLEMV